MADTANPERTPAEEMRAAATRLRETAVAPLEGIEPVFEGDTDEWMKYYGRDCADLPEGDGPWITLMSPLLAEPFAAWLEESAGHWDCVRTAGATPPGPAALAVARAINGGEQRNAEFSERTAELLAEMGATGHEPQTPDGWDEDGGESGA